MAAVARVANAEDEDPVAVRLGPLEVPYMEPASLADVQLAGVDRVGFADADVDRAVRGRGQREGKRKDSKSACSGAGGKDHPPNTSLKTQPQRPVPQRPTGRTVEGFYRRVKP